MQMVRLSCDPLYCYCFRILLLNISYHRVYLLKNVFEVFLVLVLFLPMNLFYVLDTTFLGEELCRYVSTLKDTDLDYFPLALTPVIM